eukprot:g13382.t1 g13382   contig8:563395-563922(-)
MMARQFHHIQEHGLIVDFPDRQPVRLLPSSSSKRNGESAPRRVHFNPQTRVRCFPHPPEEDVEAAWYSSDERDFIKLRQRNHARIVADVLLATPAEFVTNDLLLETLGLETVISVEVARHSMAARRRHMRSVLREQTRQELLNIRDDNALRGVSREFSSWSTERAHNIAVRFARI